jgi:hypothetical protein
MGLLNTISADPSAMGTLRLVVLILLGVAVYYIYKYLFTGKSLDSYTVLGGITNGNPTKPIDVAGDTLPGLYEGGEYSMSCWVYINDWSINKNKVKHLFEIGKDGAGNGVTLMVGLGATQNQLLVRVDNAGAPFSTGDRNGLLQPMMGDSSLRNDLQLCDLPSVDMQRWVLVTVVITGRICDVYMDGKLARSCTLPSFYRVSSGYSLKALMSGGFGGYISALTAYGYALNPADIYKIYLSGPNPSSSILDWFKSFFTPEAGATFYPKMNGL